MTSSRDRILGRIRSGNRASERSASDLEALTLRLRKPSRNTLPAFSRKRGEEAQALFVAKAEAQGCTLTKVKSAAEAREAVRDFLRQNNLPARLVLSPTEELSDLALDEAADLEIRKGAALESDVTSVTPVFKAVAETGTLVTRSGAQTPSTLNFVPENHIAIVRAADVVGSYEDSWDAVREGDMPRTVNWISGPSRSADIGLVMYMGAHGPRRQHIILIEED